MPDPQLAAFRGFDDPMAVVDSTDMTYEARLTILQDWKSALAQSGSDREIQNVVLGAIQALEMGAAVQDDQPEGAPDDGGYGASETLPPTGHQTRRP